MTTFMGGVKYFVTFIDEFSRKMWLYILKSKGDGFEKFKQCVCLDASPRQ